MYAMANAWNFGHLSSDSLSSFANSSPRGGNISRNSSQNSMGGDAPSMDSPEPGGARGMFQTWEDGISSSGSAGGGEEDTRMPKGNEGNTLLSSLFAFLDSLLAQNGATEETPSVESDIRPESFFPKVC